MLWTTPNGLIMRHKNRPKMLVSDALFTSADLSEVVSDMPRWIGDYYAPSFTTKHDVMIFETAYKNAWFSTSILVNGDAYMHVLFQNFFSMGISSTSVINPPNPKSMYIWPSDNLIYETPIKVYAYGGVQGEDKDDTPVTFKASIFGKIFSITRSYNDGSRLVCTLKIMRDGHVYINGGSRGIWPMYRLSHLFQFQ